MTNKVGDRKANTPLNTDYYAFPQNLSPAYNGVNLSAPSHSPAVKAIWKVDSDGTTHETGIENFWKNDTSLTVLRTRNGDYIETGAKTIYPNHLLLISANTTVTIKANNITVCPGAKIVIEPGAKLLIKGGNTKGDFGRLNLLGELINYGEFENQCKFVMHRGSEFINASNDSGATGNFIMKKGGVAHKADGTVNPQAEPEMLEIMNSLGNRYHTDMGQETFFWSLSKTVPIAGGDNVQEELGSNTANTPGANDGTSEGTNHPQTDTDVPTGA